MKSLEIKPIPVPKGYKHPDPPDDRLPRHEFTMTLVGQ